MSASATTPALALDGAGFLTDLLGRDPPAAVSLFHGDIEWTVPGAPEFGGGVHRGREAVLEFFELVQKLFPNGLLIAALREWDSAGGSVVEAVLKGATASGAAYENRYAFVIELEDGLVRRVREYTDTSYAERVLGVTATGSV